jgi:DNA-binding SARP family transcriptional activator
VIHLRLLGTLSLSAADGSEVRAVITQPKRFALLAYLASAGEGRFKRRDALLALFWPDSNERQARLALRQALHHLRHALGPAVISNRGDDELAIGPGTIMCDAMEFRRLLESGELDGALELYRGDFLEGFSIAGISLELEEWIEAERASLRSLAADAAAKLAVRSSRSGELGEALQWARKGLSLSPGDESVLRRLVTLLRLRGDRAGALRTAEQFARRIHDELGAEPSPEMQQLIAELRAGDEAASMDDRRPGDVPDDVIAIAPGISRTPARGERGSAIEASHLAPSESAEPLPPTVPAHSLDETERDAGSGRRVHRRMIRRAAIASAASLTLAAIVAIGAVRLHAERSAPPVIAVGWIDIGEGVDDGGAARLLPALLETGLANVPGQRTVSDARLHDLLGQMGEHAETRGAVARAARLAGATELLEGAVYHARGGTLRLDLQRVDIDDGAVVRSYSVNGRTAFDLADRAAGLIAADLELPPPTNPVRELGSASRIARRFYEEGLRTYYQVDAARSNQFFRAALREDSTCAMCAYYASLSESDAAAKLEFLRMAVRLSARAPERERLYIQSTWSAYSSAAGLLASARKLAEHYTADPEAQLKVAGALINFGRFQDAVGHLRRVIDLDSLALRGAGPHCRACDAEGMLVTAYWSLDSFPAAVRAATEWVRRQPDSRNAWAILAETYARMGRFAEARAALDSSSRLSTPAAEMGDARVRFAIRAGDFRDADSYLAYRARSGTPYARREALWWLGISLRNQGKVREALATLSVPPPARDSAIRRLAHYGWTLARGQILFETGEFQEAAALFGELAAERPAAIADMPGVLARHRSWALTHEAEALAAAGDTAGVRALVDSVRTIGAGSAMGRDRLSYHHLLGLLLSAQHDWTAAEAEFRAAIHSPTDGYLRTNLHLARVLMTEDRPRDAIEILHAALHGPLDGSGMYVTRTEVHEALGDAFHMAGEADSAAVHYRAVALAWEHGDAPFAARASRARRMLSGR